MPRFWASREPASPIVVISRDRPQLSYGDFILHEYVWSMDAEFFLELTGLDVLEMDYLRVEIAARKVKSGKAGK